MIDKSFMNKTLTELEGEDWGSAAFNSHLVQTCHQLRYKCLKDFTIEDLRIMIGQKIGLQFLISIALEILKKNTLAEGKFYPGDLICSVLDVDSSFWNNNPDLRQKLEFIIQEDIPLNGVAYQALSKYLLRMNSLHTCSEKLGLENTEYFIYQIQGRWYLNIVDYANELMVNDGEAEYVGEEVCRYIITINYCPFCGKQLS